MKIYSTNTINFRAAKNDLRFLNNIRDKDVAVFEKLQKKKIELLLKLRETKLIIERYNSILSDSTSNDFLNLHYIELKKDLEELLSFKKTLCEKLSDINQQLLKEEEKNY